MKEPMKIRLLKGFFNSDSFHDGRKWCCTERWPRKEVGTKAVYPAKLTLKYKVQS